MSNIKTREASEKYSIGSSILSLKHRHVSFCKSKFELNKNKNATFAERKTGITAKNRKTDFSPVLRILKPRHSTDDS